MTKTIWLRIVRELFWSNAILLLLTIVVLVAQGRPTFWLRYPFGVGLWAYVMWRHSPYRFWKTCLVLFLPVFSLTFIWFSLTGGAHLTVWQLAGYALVQAVLGLVCHLLLIKEREWDKNR